MFLLSCWISLCFSKSHPWSHVATSYLNLGATSLVNVQKLYYNYFYTFWKKHSFTQSSRLHEPLASVLTGTNAGAKSVQYVAAVFSFFLSEQPNLACTVKRRSLCRKRVHCHRRYVTHWPLNMQNIPYLRQVLQDVSEIRVHVTGASLLCSCSHSRVQQAAEVRYGNSVLLKVFWEIYGHWTPLLAPGVFIGVDTWLIIAI